MFEWFEPTGNTLIYAYIRRIGSFIYLFFFFWFKILNINIFGVFRKINIFLQYEDFVDIFFEVITKLDYI